jgi:hypothetical protein
MASEIVNRAMPASRLRLMNHLVSKALHLADDSQDKLVKATFDGARPGDRQIDGIRHQPKQRDLGRVTVDQTRRVKKVCNAYLMRRQPVPHRIDDICVFRHRIGTPVEIELSS